MRQITFRLAAGCFMAGLLIGAIQHSAAGDIAAAHVSTPPPRSNAATAPGTPATPAPLTPKPNIARPIGVAMQGFGWG
jgi:hypothetical protein